MDYYSSPCLDPSQNQKNKTPPPDGGGKPRRKHGRLVLILFLVLILVCATALTVLRILFPDQWHIPLDEWIQRIDGYSFHFEIPGDFFDTADDFSQAPDNSDSEYIPQENSSSTLTTIPRADLNPNVQMLLVDFPSEGLSFQEIYDKVIPSIVSIQAYSNSGHYEGTGVVMTADGYVITNHHIISGCSAADVVLFDGTFLEATLVGSDAESDLAVLKVDAQDLVPAEFGTSAQLRVGDTALAIGNPLGSELFGTMTEGIVSAINRDVNVDGYNMSLIQTTAALNPGNSGGALINSAGQVVGITNMKMMSSYDTIEGLGFAIPTVWVKEVVDILLAEGIIAGRPTIGITCFAITSGIAMYYGQDSGIFIDTVTPNGPADQAGLLPGDIILEANGYTLATLDDLILARDEAGVGGTLDLTIWRNGEILELSVTLVDQYELY